MAVGDFKAKGGRQSLERLLQLGRRTMVFQGRNVALGQTREGKCIDSNLGISYFFTFQGVLRFNKQRSSQLETKGFKLILLNLLSSCQLCTA